MADLDAELRALLADPDTIQAEPAIGRMQSALDARLTDGERVELDALAERISADLDAAYKPPVMPGPQFDWRAWLDGDTSGPAGGTR